MNPANAAPDGLLSASGLAGRVPVARYASPVPGSALADR
jgi:hypothetical protein